MLLRFGNMPEGHYKSAWEISPQESKYIPSYPTRRIGIGGVDWEPERIIEPGMLVRFPSASNSFHSSVAGMSLWHTYLIPISHECFKFALKHNVEDGVLDLTDKKIPELIKAYESENGPMVLKRASAPASTTPAVLPPAPL